MNCVILMGRLTRDPEVRYSGAESQTAVARFSIAVDRRFKRDGQPEADFFDCTAFGHTAVFTEKYLKKGTKIVLQGRIENDNYTNREGQRVYRTRIVAENLEFAESKAASQNGAASYQAPRRDDRTSAAPAGERTHSAAPAPADVPGDDFMNIPDGIEEDLPFT